MARPALPWVIEHLSRHDDDTHRRRIHQLRAAGCPEDLHLANTLAQCTRDFPCRSAACINCGRAFQQIAFQLYDKHIRGFARRDLRGRMFAITVVPATGCLAPDDLTADACRRVVDDVCTALAACGTSVYALSLDISFNDDTTGAVCPYWSAHAHVAGPDWWSKAKGKSFKAAFPASVLVSRPVRIDQLDANDVGLLYLFKPNRVRRVTYLNESHPSRAPFRDNHRYVLRPHQAVTLAHVEHELGFAYRLIASGINKDTINDALVAFYSARDGL